MDRHLISDTKVVVILFKLIIAKLFLHMIFMSSAHDYLDLGALLMQAFKRLSVDRKACAMDTS